MTEFLQCFLLRDGGIYTLFGSKPITVSWIESANSKASPLTMRQFLLDLAEKEEFVKRSSMMHTTITEDTHLAVWERVQQQLSMRNFLFLKKSNPILWDLPSDHPEADAFNSLLLINQQSLKHVLAKYYQVFQQAIGEDFSIDAVVSALDDEEGLFWQKIWNPNRHYTQGILLGYGAMNAKIFDVCSAMESLEEARAFHNTMFRKDEETKRLANGGWEYSCASCKLRLDQIPLPVFMCADDKYEHYALERNSFVKIFKDRDFLEVVLERLQSSEEDFSLTISAAS